MDIQESVTSQYYASLEMIQQAIAKCPDFVWNDIDDKNKFWHIAYHALFFTHLYLQDSEQSFKPWNRHRKDYQFLGSIPWSPDKIPQIDDPYDKTELLEYLTSCQQQIAERVPQLNLEATSGFNWLPFNKLELQFYNLRHLQQHIGELMERLGSRAKMEIDWVIRHPN